MSERLFALRGTVSSDCCFLSARPPARHGEQGKRVRMYNWAFASRGLLLERCNDAIATPPCQERGNTTCTMTRRHRNASIATPPSPRRHPLSAISTPFIATPPCHLAMATAMGTLRYFRVCSMQYQFRAHERTAHPCLLFWIRHPRDCCQRERRN